MPKEAINPFEAKYQKFDVAASQQVVKRPSILRSLTYFEKEGVAQTRSGDLNRDEFVKKMHFAIARVLDLDEQGVIEPPLTPNKITELTEKNDLFEALAPKADEAVADPAPTPVDTIPTSKQKK